MITTASPKAKFLARKKIHLSLTDRQARSFPVLLTGKSYFIFLSQKLHSCLSKQFKALPSSPAALHITRILRHSVGSWSQTPPIEQGLCICNPELAPWVIWKPPASDRCSCAHLWTLALLIWTPDHWPAILIALCHVLVPTALPTPFRLCPTPVPPTRSYPAPRAGWYPSLTPVSWIVLCK